jgi:PAS domain S-box-containing protein
MKRITGLRAVNRSSNMSVSISRRCRAALWTATLFIVAVAGLSLYRPSSAPVNGEPAAPPVSGMAALLLFLVATVAPTRNGRRDEKEPVTPGAEVRAERFRAVASQVPGAIYAFRMRPDGTFSIPYATPGFRVLFGLSADEVVEDAAPVFARVHPDDLPQIQASILESARTLSVWRAEGRVLHPELGEVWIEGQSVPQREADGSVIWYGSFSDITRRRQAEAALRERDELNQAVLDSVLAQMAVLGPDGTIRAVNDAWRRFARENGGQNGEIPPNTEVGANYLSVLCSASGEVSADLKPIYDGIRGVLGGTLPVYSHEYGCETPEGLRWFHLSVTPLPAGQGGAVVSHLDVTERKREEEERAYVMDRARCLLYHATVTETGHPHYLHWDVHYPAEETGQRFFPVNVKPGETYLKAQYLARLPEDRRRCEALSIACIRAGKSYEQEFRARAADGTLRWMHEAFRVETIEPARKWRVVAVCTDITERKQAELTLRESENRFRQMAESLPQIVWTSTPEGTTDYISPRWTEYTGVPAEQSLGYIWLNYLHPDDRESVLPAWQAAARTGDTFAARFRIRRHDGIYRWFDTRGAAVRDADGNIVKWFGSSTDIEDGIRREEELREERDRFERIVATAPGAICSFRLRPDGTACFPYASPRIEDLLGMTVEELAHDAAPVFARIHPEDLPTVEAAIAESARTMTEWRCEFRYHHPTAGEIWVDGRSVPAGEPDASILWHGIVTDITERKRSDERIRSVMESARCLLWSAEVTQLQAQTYPDSSLPVMEWRFLHFDNEAAQRFMSLDVPPGRSYSEISYSRRHIEDRDRSDLVGAAGLLANRDYSQEYRVQRADGEWRWHREEVRVKSLGPGRWYAVGVVVDVTEEKRAAEALQRQWEFLRSVIDTGPNMIFVKDADGVFTLANRALAEAYGTTVEELEGKTDADFNPDAEAVAAYREMDRRTLAALGETFVAEEAFRNPDGTVRWLQTWKRPIPSPDGSRYEVLGVASDITARKRAEEELRNSEKRLTHAQSTAHLGYADTDLRTGRMFWSDELYRILGYEPQSFAPTKERYLSRIHPDDAPAFQKALKELLQNGSPSESEYRIVRPDGSVRWVYGQRETAYDAQGRPIHLLGTVLDITERKEAEEALRELNTTLERRVEERTAQLASANRELEAFSYSVSHDLRAPLRTIDGFSQALLEDYADALDETGRDYLHRIRRGSQHMGQLIDDLLSLSRVTRADLQRGMVDLSVLAAEVAERLRQGDPDRAARVEMVIASGVCACGDDRLLGIAIENLIGNAWKYTARHERARIEFGVTRRDDRSARETVYFVRDDGAGFDMAYAEKLFGVFQRLHKPSEFDGTGVGLATVQRIVHRHGGRIWAEAAPEQGATFYFTLGCDDAGR